MGIVKAYVDYSDYNIFSQICFRQVQSRVYVICKSLFSGAIHVWLCFHSYIQKAYKLGACKTYEVVYGDKQEGKFFLSAQNTYSEAVQDTWVKSLIKFHHSTGEYFIFSLY